MLLSKQGFVFHKCCLCFAVVKRAFGLDNDSQPALCGGWLWQRDVPVLASLIGACHINRLSVLLLVIDYGHLDAFQRIGSVERQF